MDQNRYTRRNMFGQQSRQFSATHVYLEWK